MANSFVNLISDRSLVCEIDILYKFDSLHHNH